MSALEVLASLCLAVSLFAAYARFHPQNPDDDPQVGFSTIRSTWWRWSILSLAADAVSAPLLTRLLLQPGPPPAQLYSFLMPAWLLLLVISLADAVRSVRFRSAMGELATVEGSRPSQTPTYVLTVLWLALAMPWPFVLQFNRGAGAAYAAFVGFIAFRMIMALSFGRLTKEPSILNSDPELADLVARSGVKVNWLGHGAGAQFNAFALPGGKIIIVGPRSSLPTRQAHAIIAHELTHLKYGDVDLYVRMLVARSIFGLAVSLPVLISAGDQLTWGHCLVAIALARAANGLVTLAFGPHTRRHEFRADREAASIVDPDSIANGLTRIHLAQGAPDVWPRWLEPFMTHPPLKQRIAAIRASAPSEGTA